MVASLLTTECVPVAVLFYLFRTTRSFFFLLIFSFLLLIIIGVGFLRSIKLRPWFITVEPLFLLFCKSCFIFINSVDVDLHYSLSLSVGSVLLCRALLRDLYLVYKFVFFSLCCAWPHGSVRARCSLCDGAKPHAVSVYHRKSQKWVARIYSTLLRTHTWTANCSHDVHWWCLYVWLLLTPQAHGQILEYNESRIPVLTSHICCFFFNYEPEICFSQFYFNVQRIATDDYVSRLE